MLNLGKTKPCRILSLLGGGGHAKVVANTLIKHGDYNILGFLDDDVSKTTLLGRPRLGSLSPHEITTNCKNVAIGLGHIGRVAFRSKIINNFLAEGFNIETVIAPSAIIGIDVSIGQGSFIADGVIIQPGASIGDFCILNTNSSIDHDTIIGSNTHIAPGAAISGAVTIGNSCLIGTGAAIIQGVRIADRCIIGAGSAVIANCSESGNTYFGVPTKIKSRNKDE